MKTRSADFGGFSKILENSRQTIEMSPRRFDKSQWIFGTPVTRGPGEETIQGAECGCRAEGRRLVEETRSLTPDCHPSVRVFVLFAFVNKS
jgi:hypothetical protein